MWSISRGVNSSNSSQHKSIAHRFSNSEFHSNPIWSWNLCHILLLLLLLLPLHHLLLLLLLLLNHHHIHLPLWLTSLTRIAFCFEQTFAKPISNRSSNAFSLTTTKKHHTHVYQTSNFKPLRTKYDGDGSNASYARPAHGNVEKW